MTANRRGFFRNWGLKLAALFLAVMLYVAVAAQEQYTQQFPMRIEVQAPPGRTMLNTPPPVTVVLRGKGGELLKLRLFRQVITLQVPETLSVATWTTILQHANVELPKGADVQVDAITPREVVVQLDSVGTKDVPIVARVSVRPDSGQALDGGLQIAPNVARLVGPDPLLAAIESVATVPTTLDAVHGPFTRLVTLDTSPLGVVRLSPKEVRVSGTTTTVFVRVFNFLPIESGAGPVDHRGQRREVRAARQLGDDAAKDLMDVLRENDEAGQLGRTAPRSSHQEGGRRFVTRRLDSQDDVSHGRLAGAPPAPSRGRLGR